MTEPFEIEENAFYRALMGTVEGPMRISAGQNMAYTPTRGAWRLNGRYGFAASGKHGMDLVERVHVLSDAELQAVKVEAGRKALATYDSIKADTGNDICSVGFGTKEGGRVVLAHWPEGFVLRYHGEIVWRSWEHDKKITSERAAAGLKKIGDGISAEIDKLVKDIDEEVARCLGVKKEMLGGAADAKPKTDSAKPDAPTKVKVSLSDLVAEAVATVTLGMPWQAYAKAVRAFEGFLMQGRALGISRARALTVLEEELKKSMADPKASTEVVIGIAIHRLIEEQFR